jgi:hypothetical protein
MSDWNTGPITKNRWETLRYGEAAYALTEEDAVKAVEIGCVWRLRGDGLYDVKRPESALSALETAVLRRIEKAGGTITHGMLRNTMRGCVDEDLIKSIDRMVRKNALRKSERVHKYTKMKVVAYELV